MSEHITPAPGDGCPVCTGRKPAKAGMVVRCYTCKMLVRHSRAEYTTSYGDYKHHHFCKRCEAFNVYSMIVERASEVRAERLNEQVLYKYELPSEPGEDIERAFIDYLKHNNLPVAWAR